MPNYANSKVYKLINSVDGKIYSGSTTVSLSMRLAQHKCEATRKNNPVYRHFNTIGWDTVRIILIETVTCINKEQLIQREQHYIDLLKPSLNKNSAYTNCPHGRQHNSCIECHGSSICEHNKRKQICKQCHGVSICEHNKRKHQCKECGGVSICIHNKLKQRCKECGGSDICIHHNIKSRCHQCGGSSICEHNIRKTTCKICSPKYCEYCDITTGKSTYTRHTKLKKHIYNFIHY